MRSKYIRLYIDLFNDLRMRSKYLGVDMDLFSYLRKRSQILVVDISIYRDLHQRSNISCLSISIYLDLHLRSKYLVVNTDLFSDPRKRSNVQAWIYRYILIYPCDQHMIKYVGVDSDSFSDPRKRSTISCLDVLIYCDRLIDHGFLRLDMLIVCRFPRAVGVIALHSDPHTPVLKYENRFINHHIYLSIIHY